MEESIMVAGREAWAVSQPVINGFVLREFMSLPVPQFLHQWNEWVRHIVALALAWMDK